VVRQATPTGINKILFVVSLSKDLVIASFLIPLAPSKERGAKLNSFLFSKERSF